jgi:2-polyprenyl-3-methyl-5-hydroxy-6-metoxy-1,4-benzoquinol methylase
LATLTAPLQRHLNAEFSSNAYTSMILQLYIETFKKYSNVQVLDVGPVCEENIMFFAQQVKRLYICDMFLRLDRTKRKGLHSQTVWKHLDYPPHFFDGIHLWDFIDHLNDNDVGRLVKLCHTLLKPKGMLMATAFEEQSAPSQINSFVIEDDFRLTFRPQTHVDLPWYFRTNRILTSMLSAFSNVKSFIYRNGVREFLFKRD